MRFREWWTLVRYAGPASKASIGSKPIGSELKRYVGIYLLQVNKKLIWGTVSARGMRAAIGLNAQAEDASA
jgi:hypothetical protein